MEEMTLEQGFEKLDEMIEKLEGKDLSLEEAFSVYAEGMKMLKFCNDSIDRVEKKMLLINEQGDYDEF